MVDLRYAVSAVSVILYLGFLVSGVYIMLITIDTDWAADEEIDRLARYLCDREVYATWFISHASPAIRRLVNTPFFSIGIHPNFQEGSTQGESPRKVLEHCLKLVPGAAAMSTHGCYFTHDMMGLAAGMGITVDYSTFLPGCDWTGDYETSAGVVVRIVYAYMDYLHWLHGRMPKITKDSVLRFHPQHAFKRKVKKVLDKAIEEQRVFEA